MTDGDQTTSSGPAGETDADQGSRLQAPTADTHRATDAAESAPRRTLMAAERTYLAWLRTGLGAVGLSLAVGRVLPALLGGTHVGYILLGVGYGALGLFLIGYALLRARLLQKALVSGAPVTLDWWALAVSTVVGIVLALATIMIILAEA